MIIANSGIVHFKPLRLNPNIRMDDGVLSVCHIRARSLLDYVRIAGGILSGHPGNTPELTCEDARQTVEVQTQKPLPIQADGELIGYTPVSVELVPAAVDFLAPADSMP